MIRPLLAVACLLAAAAPAAADPAYDFHGGCVVVAVASDAPQPPAPATWTVAVVASVVAANAGGSPAAVPVAVGCEVGGEAVPLVTAPGIGAATAVGTATRSFATDVPFTVCDVVTVAGEPHRRCEPTTIGRLVPDPVTDAVETAFDSVYSVLWYVDPGHCPVFGSLSGLSVPGAVDVTPEGDIHVVTQGRVWDCPPYNDYDDGGRTLHWRVRVP